MANMCTVRRSVLSDALVAFASECVVGNHLRYDPEEQDKLAKTIGIYIVEDDAIPHCYTLGHEESYDKLLEDADSNPPRKSGPRMVDGSPYLGGIAFETPEDAEKWLEANERENWAIYEVEADWKEDVWNPINEEGHQRFRRDVRITSKVYLIKE